MKNTSTTGIVPESVSVDISGMNARRFGNFAILAAFCFVLLFLGLGELPFYTRGEPREGLVVWEMYRSGNWILLSFNGYCNHRDLHSFPTRRSRRGASTTPTRC